MSSSTIKRSSLLSFGHVLIPEAVWHELRSPAAPKPVKAFLETWPSWLERRIVSEVPQDLQQLDPGEREAIALAQSVGASLVLANHLPYDPTIAPAHSGEAVILKVEAQLGVKKGAKPD